MKADHNRAPVLEALAEYHRQGRTSFSPPGHKQARGADRAVREILGEAVFLGDVLASGGLDDRLTRGQVLQRAEELMADVVHADHTFFTTCGSSLSVKAAMLAVAGPQERLLIGRDAHKSVVSGLILAGIEPVWVEPQWDAERHLAHPPSPADFDRAFTEHPGVKGALVTSPTPYGTCADLRALAEICHGRSLPLIVDEAWGAHLPFHPDLPSWAMDAGADICVTSVHKMGSGLEQGSVFHLQGDLVPPHLLKMRSDLLGSTSPSVLIYAGLDGWRRQMALHGKELMGAALALAARVRASVERLDGMHVNDRDDFCGAGLAHDLDPLIVTIEVDGLGMTGYRAADWLRQYRSIDVHLTDHRRIGAQITHGDDEETVGELIAALEDLAAAASGLRPVPGVKVPPPAELHLEQVRTPREAFFGPTEDVPTDRAAGRIAAEMITPYPPGIPVVLPGERLTEPVLRYLLTGRDAGMNLPDPSDPHLETIRVTAGTE
ncbi:aminotransferase class I/II-fold pyridoxal phosphate-dependent enzyme [Streptomyces sp. NBC_00287]|uniref:aminotransferase class I/II-fold pyridoxal phosphate-dependent enzyme n=1 Tax=Streptomyces sp. NBC_00287 TaxID=2975702 RepID=UPI002E2A69D7|nr:aminotransferase class I/II-fold pyridoxal phosphate-dependent enzyme [Streptomyces sp. NBC_00287]